MLYLHWLYVMSKLWPYSYQYVMWPCRMHSTCGTVVPVSVAPYSPAAMRDTSSSLRRSSSLAKKLKPLKRRREPGNQTPTSTKVTWGECLIHLVALRKQNTLWQWHHTPTILSPFTICWTSSTHTLIHSTHCFSSPPTLIHPHPLLFTPPPHSWRTLHWETPSILNLFSLF